MAARQAYSASIDLAFDCNGQRENISSEKIIYIMIEHDYENKVLPIIYLSLAVNSDLYSKIMNNKNSAKFYLNINKQNVSSSSSLSKKSICGTFNYVPSDSNPNYSESLNKDTSMSDSSYKKIMLGLISIDLTNQLRKSFNNVYNNIDTNTLISLALEGTKPVIEKIKYNKTYDRILVPPISNRLKMLEFIFGKDEFYDTNFRYFIDFEKSYLLSKSGDAIDAGDGQIQSVILDIRSVTAQEAYYEGIEVKNGAYYIYVNPAASNVTLNQGTEKVANEIVAVDDDTSEVKKIPLNINNTEGSDTKQMFIRTSNAALYKNELESNTIVIEVVKQNIDGSYFTPNKAISISNYGEYSKYNGKYYMVYKRELFKPMGSQFEVSCSLGLKKVGNITPANSTTDTSAASKSCSKTATRTSSANRSSNSKMISSF